MRDLTEKQWWTYDEKGPCYCSVVSLEDAVRGHLREHHRAPDQTGPIVDIRYYHRPPVPAFEVEFYGDDTSDKYDTPRLED